MKRPTVKLILVIARIIIGSQKSILISGIDTFENEMKPICQLVRNRIFGEWQRAAIMEMKEGNSQC